MKTKALISFAVTAKLICDFVFAYAKSWFSHDEAQIIQPYSQCFFSDGYDIDVESFFLMSLMLGEINIQYFLCFCSIIEPHHEKTCPVFATRCDTNRAVQPQKEASVV